MYGNSLNGAFTAMLVIAIVIGAAVAIGLEHLVIWLWHHLSIHWSP